MDADTPSFYSATFLTGLFAEYVDRVFELPTSFSRENDRFAGHSFAVRTSRSAEIHRDSSSEWLFEQIEQVMEFVNRGYQFDVVAIESPIQLLRYEIGGEIDWHMDTQSQTKQIGDFLERKISFSIQLSPTDQYNGGNLEFVASPADPFARSVGTVIAFPSFLAHRVTQVTHGRRNALVAFALGSRFR